jgi:alkanesulfonate monooxygenase SsuD/methylene tetrahydromethanopterin reductase-like flavin-dependent oxidoreductase (luciferase family)
MKFGLMIGTGGPVKPVDEDLWAPDRQRQRLEESLELAALAEQVGFDYLWATEHHFTPDFSHYPDSMMILAAAARHTTRMRIGTGILQLSHRHPLNVAESVATLDLLSGGRVELGVGTGNPAEYIPFVGAGQAADGRARRAEATPLVARMLAQRGRFPGFAGDHFTIPPVNIVPNAVQDPHPPLWLAGTRPETITEAARCGMGSLVLSFLGVEQIDEQVRSYWDTLLSSCNPAGLTVNPAVATFSMALIADTDEEAVERSTPGIGYAGYGGVRNDGEHVSAAQVNHYRDYLAARNRSDDDSEKRFISGFEALSGHLVGSRATVLDKVRAIAATHVDMLGVVVQSDPIEHEDAVRTIREFGQHILPEFASPQGEHQQWRERQLKQFDLPIVTSV